MKLTWYGLNLIGCLLVLGYGPTLRADENFQSHFLYTGTNPDHVESDWSNNTQGLAHDDTHWYIAQKNRLWRVPATVNLASLSFNTPGVQQVPLGNIPALASEGYNHLGDLVFYQHQGQGFLLIPIEEVPSGLGGDPLKGGVAVFRADASLAYIDHQQLFPHPGSLQSNCAWLAVDAAGNMYSSAFNDVDHIIQYPIFWNLLVQNNQLLISTVNAVALPLTDENGGPLSIDAIQGGEIAPGDSMLYLVNGLPGCPSGIAGSIHALAFPQCRRVVQSSPSGLDHFFFSFDPHCPSFDEPEGLTIWDLEGLGSPQRGKLHVIVVDNDDPDTDDVMVKHYTNVIMVDGGHSGVQTGTPELPFHTVTGAANLAWDGAEIRIRANTYPEALTISKRIRLTAEGGTARIGD